VLLAALTLLLSPVTVTGTVAAVGDLPPPFHPTRLTSLGDARQVVVVISGSWSSSRARLRAYEKTAAGTWRLRLGPVDARLGRNGLVDDNDWWPYDPRDPATYNVWQPRRAGSARWRTSWAEDLSSYGRQYRHAAVIAYNLPTAITDVDTRRGGGIFLHVDRPGATTGCVSVAQADLERVLLWLDPTQAPVIVMGPRSAVTRM